MASSIPAVIGLLSAAFGAGALGGMKGNRTQTTDTSYDRFTKYTPDPAYRGLQDLLMKFTTDRLGAEVPMAGYEAGGITDINRTYQLADQTLRNRLTSMGLGNSPVAGAAGATLEAGRGGSIAKFLTDLPLIERQLQQQDFENAYNFLGTRPIDVRETGTGKGTTVYPGSWYSGGVNSVMDMLGFLMGKGMIGGGSKTQVGRPPY